MAHLQSAGGNPIGFLGGNGINLSSTGGSSTISQRFPPNSLKSLGDLTCVFYTDGGVVFRDIGQYVDVINYVDFLIEVGNEVTVYGAAIYRGSYTQKTLPPWKAPDAASEYLKCRRYWRNFDVSLNNIVGVCFYPNAIAIIGAVLDIPMRGTPTCKCDKVTSIDQSTTYNILDYFAGPDGVTWLAVNSATPISVGQYVYIIGLQLSRDL